MRAKVKSTKVAFGLMDKGKILQAIALPRKRRMTIAEYARWATMQVVREELKRPGFHLFPLRQL